MDANGELTPAELVLLRTHPQRTDLYLAIPTYATVYTAVIVTPIPPSNDGVYELIFNGGAGVTWANVVPGMTLLVGTLAGGSDIGFARIRSVITTTDAGITGTIYIGTTSEIDFAAGQHLTITNEFGLWPRHPYVNPVTGEEFMDWDIDYDNVADPQHVYFAPVPCMFPSAVVELSGASVSVTFDATDSWAPILYLPPTYIWACDGATFPPGSTITKTFTFTSAGTYLVSLTYIADYGGGHTATSIGYRYVIVYDDAHPLIKSPILESCSGDFDNGGWSYRVTCHSQADLATIHNRTLCILMADDWYGATHQSIGPISGRENIVCIGWIDGESIKESNDTGDVSFDVQGPQWWFDRMPGYPTGVDDSLVASTAWTIIENLTARAGLWHFLLWRTTAAAIMDIPSVARHGWTTPDARRLATTYTPAGSLWEQLRAIADRIFARATCNRYGQLFINVDNQLVDPAIRGTHPNILGAGGFTDADWRDEITIERRTVPEAALVDLSGVFWSGTIATSSALFSLAPGHYFKHYGRPAMRDRIALTDQTEANLLAGLYLGWLNNEYPNVDVPFAASSRCFDIAPYQFSWMTIAAGDTLRGIEWINKRLIPRRVSFERDEREAVLLADVTFEAETFANTAMIGDPPIEPPEPDPTDPPDPPCVCDDPTALNYGGACPCEYVPVIACVIVFNATQLARSIDFYDAPPHTPTWANIKTSGLAGVNVGAIANCVVASNASAWVLTYKDEATLGDNGIFYCSDILATTPIWTLIQSLTAYRADGRTGFPRALSVDTNNIFYTQCDNVQQYGYGTSTVTWITSTNPPPTRVPLNTQHSVGMVVGVRGSHSPAPTPGKAIITMVGGIDTLVLYSTLINDTACVAGNHAIETAGGDFGNLISYTDSAVLNGSTIVNIYSGADWRTPVVSDGVNVLTIQFSTGYLMNLAVAIAVPLTAFGAVRSGGGYCFGLAGYGEIIWVARDVGVTTNFIAMRDTGGGWTDKTGDFNTAIGAWAGSVGGIMPAPMTI